MEGERLNQEPNLGAYKRFRAELSRKLDVWAACERAEAAGFVNLVPEMSEALGIPEILQAIADEHEGEVNLAIALGRSKRDPKQARIRSALLELLRKYLLQDAKRFGHCRGRESKPMKQVISHKDVPYEWVVWCEMSKMLPDDVARAARKVRPRKGKWQGMGSDRLKWNEWRQYRRQRETVDKWLTHRAKLETGHATED